MDKRHAQRSDAQESAPPLPSVAHLRRLSHPRRAVVCAIILLVAIASSFAVGRFLQPPDREQLSEAQKPIRVTAQVEERVVDARTALAGTVVSGRVQPVTLAVRPDPAVVTRQSVSEGDTLRPGDLVGAVSGQPVFVLPAPLALYRDLRVGDRGDDVSSLQDALRETGADVDTTGWVDWKTRAAVTRLFEDHGFPSPTSAGSPAGTAPADDSETPVTPTSPAHTGGGEDPDPFVLPYTSFVPLSVPEATVVSALTIGARVTDDSPLVSVQTSGNTVSFRADAVQAADYEPDQTVTISADGQQLNGTVTRVGEFAEASEGKPPGRDITAGSDDDRFAELAAGLSVTITPEGQHATSTAVPTVALRHDADGDFVLIVEGDDPETDLAPPRRVGVTVDYAGNGWTALAGGAVKPGMTVVVQ
ncbi:MAG: hypothetical protein ACTJHU_01810 [Mycetocola sp.]